MAGKGERNENFVTAGVLISFILLQFACMLCSAARQCRLVLRAQNHVAVLQNGADGSRDIMIVVQLNSANQQLPS